MAYYRRISDTQGICSITMSYRKSFTSNFQNPDGTRSLKCNHSGTTVSLTQACPPLIFSSKVNNTREEVNNEASSPAKTLSQNESRGQPPSSVENDGSYLPSMLPQPERETERTMLGHNFENEPITEHARLVAMWNTVSGPDHLGQQSEESQRQKLLFMRSVARRSRPIPFPRQDAPPTAGSSSRHQDATIQPDTSHATRAPVQPNTSQATRPGSISSVEVESEDLPTTINMLIRTVHRSFRNLPPQMLGRSGLLTLFVPSRNDEGGVHLGSFLHDPMRRVFRIQQVSGDHIVLIPLQPMQRNRPRPRQATPVPAASLKIIEQNTECFLYYTVPVPNKKTKDDDDVQNCTICLSDLGYETYVRRLPCKHLFHKDCIEKWLSTNKTCALCRRDITA